MKENHVSVNETTSRRFNIDYSGVQGSFTGPTLFSTIVSQLGNVYLDIIRYVVVLPSFWPSEMMMKQVDQIKNKYIFNVCHAHSRNCKWPPGQSLRDILRIRAYAIKLLC